MKKYRLMTAIARDILIIFLMFSSRTYAVDATKFITMNKKFGDWQLLEFAGSNQVIYRIGTESLNHKTFTMTYDFLPSAKCIAAPAAVVIQIGNFLPHMANGHIVMGYKIPGKSDSNPEIFETEMSEGDTYAFIKTKFTIERIAAAKDKGRLAMWVAPSGDGTVQRSSNIYFSLNGFSTAVKKAKQA